MRACTCAVLICAAPIPPGATLIVPLAVIGPPVSPAPVAMLVTVPAPPAKVPQTTLPSAATDCTPCAPLQQPL